MIPSPLPLIPGVEGAGVIEEVAEEHGFEQRAIEDRGFYPKRNVVANVVAPLVDE